MKYSVGDTVNLTLTVLDSFSRSMSGVVQAVDAPNYQILCEDGVLRTRIESELE